MAEQHRRRVLIVDDEDDMHVLLRAVLARGPFDIVGAAHDGEEALHIAATTAVDVAVVDYWMPGLDGIATSRALKRMQPACIVVLTSAISVAKTKIDDAEVDHFVDKMNIIKLHELLRSASTAPTSEG